jgi:ParB-like chromosome segregation protein Spo0J
MEKIDQSLESLVVELDTLTPLENNPRRGNVEAIMASYREFGQMKPIVIKSNGDGTSTVISGNHQVEAARRLGWTKIAAVPMDATNEKAVAFALADNRVSELGHSDTAMVYDLLETVSAQYVELLDGLGWDVFEMASLEEATYLSSDGSSPGVIMPSITVPDPVQLRVEMPTDEGGEAKIVAGDDVDHVQVAIQGSTVAAPGSAPQAVVQYTLVFDNPDQQKRWYDFVRWLRNDPGYDGDTTAEKIMSFIDAHSEV